MSTSGRVRSRYRRLSLRARIIALTAVVLTAVVGAGGVLMVVAVRAELIDAADDIGQTRAAGLVEPVQRGALASTLPMAGDEEAAVQVVADGRVLSSTANLDGEPPLDLPSQPAGSTLLLGVDELPLEEAGPYRVTAHGVDTPTGDATIFVAVSVDDAQEMIATAVRVATIVLAALVLALCAAMWVFIGRTLARVEAIRDRAEAISGRHLDRRVPEPVYDDEIGRLARTFNAMLARLEDSAERQRRFVADAAHELRSPIASLRAQVETARDNGSGGRIELVGPDLMAETLRMQVLVDQLLLLARSDGRSLPLHRRAVDLDDTVDAAVASVLPHRVAVDLAAIQPVQVSGDADLLEQVIRNLLENALRHARAQVRVSVSQHGTDAQLSVDDDGPGIPEQHRLAVFGRFTRLDDARDRGGGGVGLGLAIVADIVAAHRGRVEVMTAPGGGARVTVWLPLSDPAEDPATSRRSLARR